MLDVLDIGGTFAFAIAGAFLAVRHDLDFLGIMVLAILTGVGGGIVRDVLIGATPPAVFQNEFYLLVCMVGGIAVFWFAPPIARRWDRVMVADTIGLGVFAAIGAAKASAYGLGPIGVVMMAAITATGGGVMRDVLVREVPVVLRKDFYATAALLGGLCFLLLESFGLPEPLLLAGTIVVTSGLRTFAMVKNLSLPRVRMR